MSKNFEELLKALNATEAETDATLAKAQAPAAASGEELDDDPEAGAAGGEGGDDAAIAAAAAEAGAAAGEAGEFGKSFEFTDAEGNKHQAVDATEMVKSLLERADRTEDVLAKALTAMNGVVAKQGELIKSLTDQVKALSSQGRGRKAVLAVVEKPEAGVMAKSQGADEGVSVEQFFAKANAAFDAGKITGRELTVIDVCRRTGQAPEADLINKVLSA